MAFVIALGGKKPPVHPYLTGIGFEKIVIRRNLSVFEIGDIKTSAIILA